MPSDQAQRAQLFAILGEAFRQRFSETTIAAYEMGLGDVPPARLKDAITKAIQAEEFCPTPAKLREMAGASNVGGSLEAKAMLAWAAVDDAIDRVGAYRAVDFSDPVVNATVRQLGGWPRLCDLPLEEFHKWTRQTFIKVYMTLSRGGVSDEAARPLAGIGGQAGEVRAINGKRHLLEEKPPIRVDVETGDAKGLPSPLAPVAPDRSGIAVDQSIPRLEMKRP